jgi:hypothetical protein
VKELKVSVARMKMYTVGTSVSGITRERLILTMRSDEVVTDRIIVTDEAVRMINAGR